ncbi:DinB family protein [Phycicoccus endophyticus]|uniref:DinB family protein n=1 Tax=Phycicoccus endophyticus TaxID=1690220 RepID=A0A7G9R4K3_9MICO|nr:DinB family protein [Phycicoccus endophyticus]NHI18420.1 DinB family protein [Phycicoccus endophyticus]QNN50528.1 DinB family protein [Phycicoccus endophyticus]
MSLPPGTASDLHHYLQQGRDAVLRALDGLPEYDARRPLTPTGTNLLGVVKHLSGVEIGYLSRSVGRAAPPLPWDEDGSVWEGGDMWARAEETREEVLGRYRRAWALSDSALASLPLDHPAEPPWWPAERRRTTFGHLVVRVVAETAQHAGHLEILREQLDGQAGRDHDMLDAAGWERFVARIQAAADAHR